MAEFEWPAGAVHSHSSSAQPISGRTRFDRPLSAEAADGLKDHKGSLLLGRIEQLSEVAAISLKNHVGKLEISDSSVLPDEVRKLLGS